MRVRQYKYHSTLLHLFPSIYDFNKKKHFLFSIIIVYLSGPHHEKKILLFYLQMSSASFYLSCLNHVNEHTNISTATRLIFMRFLSYKNTFLYIFNLQFRSCLHQVNKLQMVQNLIFYISPNMFLYLIHLLHIFLIKLFSPPEMIFTNDEHVFKRI